MKPSIWPVRKIRTALQAFALTFDDGPHPEITPLLLDVLDRAGAKATFFLVGERALQYPDLVARIVERGHLVASHGFAHEWNWWRAPRTLRHDLLEAERVLGGVLPPPKLFRPPHGIPSPNWLMAGSDLGYMCVLWSISSNDWRDSSPEGIVRRVRRRLRAGSILLFHECRAQTGEGYGHTVEAVEQLLSATNGLQSVTVHELFRSARKTNSD
jgi:peptidoglycan/xylan/chitin deacetylase (PgdA/CDA1 family)